MRRRVLIVLAGLFAGIAAAEPASRVVSLDYCADQYLLELLPRDRILALSPDAAQDFSYHRERADGLPGVRPVAEEVIALGPALVVRSYGGGDQALRFFDRAGIDVLQVPYAGDLDAVRQATLDIATGLGVPERGAALVARMDARLKSVEPGTTSRSALYLTAGGATSGPGTLIHEMIETAGFQNFETRPGWHSVPLERLAYEEPDLVVAAFFDGAVDRTAYWSAMRHPVALRQLQERPAVLLPGAWMACGAWFVVDAIEALAQVK